MIPASFVPHHKFPIPFDPAAKIAELPPPEVPPPEDSDLKLLIDGFATLVARCGKIFEDLSKEKNRSNPLFSFLFGGNGHNYYERKLWEAQQKSINQRRLPDDMPSKPSSQNMTAESRGKILGEKQLERSSMESISSVREIINLQSNLSDTFTKPESAVSSHSLLPSYLFLYKYLFCCHFMQFLRGCSSQCLLDHRLDYWNL